MLASQIPSKAKGGLQSRYFLKRNKLKNVVLKRI